MNNRTKGKIIKGVVTLGAFITFLSLAMIVIDVFVKGIPHLTADMFAWKYSSDNLSMMPSIINTLMMVALALAIAGPIGIISAIYLNEYASKNSKIKKPVRLTTQTLAGIPSIIYGLFGNLFFVTFLGWKYSILAGACTLAIMILPTIMTSTEEALMSVPNSQREASYGLGAMKLRTIFNIILPSAIPGILSGVVLAVGRIIGETAALLYTAGSAARIPNNVMSSGRTIAIHMYMLSSEGLHKNQAYATGVVLLLLVLVINRVSTMLANKISERSQNG